MNPTSASSTSLSQCYPYNPFTGSTLFPPLPPKAYKQGSPAAPEGCTPVVTYSPMVSFIPTPMKTETVKTVASTTFSSAKDMPTSSITTSHIIQEEEQAFAEEQFATVSTATAFPTEQTAASFASSSSFVTHAHSAAQSIPETHDGSNFHPSNEADFNQDQESTTAPYQNGTAASATAASRPTQAYGKHYHTLRAFERKWRHIIFPLREVWHNNWNYDPKYNRQPLFRDNKHQQLWNLHVQSLYHIQLALSNNKYFVPEELLPDNISQELIQSAKEIQIWISGSFDENGRKMQRMPAPNKHIFSTSASSASSMTVSKVSATQEWETLRKNWDSAMRIAATVWQNHAHVHRLNPNDYCPTFRFPIHNDCWTQYELFHREHAAKKNSGLSPDWNKWNINVANVQDLFKKVGKQFKFNPDQVWILGYTARKAQKNQPPTQKPDEKKNK